MKKKEENADKKKRIRKRKGGRRENGEKELRTGDSLLIINNLDKQLHLCSRLESVGIELVTFRPLHLHWYYFSTQLIYPPPP
jgi:hypothetical protein